MKGIHPSFLAQGESHGYHTGASTRDGVSLPPALPFPCAMGALKLQKLEQPPISIAEAKNSDRPPNTSQGQESHGCLHGRLGSPSGETENATSDYNRLFSIPDMSGFS